MESVGLHHTRPTRTHAHCHIHYCEIGLHNILFPFCYNNIIRTYFLFVPQCYHGVFYPKFRVCRDVVLTFNPSPRPLYSTSGTPVVSAAVPPLNNNIFLRSPRTLLTGLRRAHVRQYCIHVTPAYLQTMGHRRRRRRGDFTIIRIN